MKNEGSNGKENFEPAYVYYVLMTHTTGFDIYSSTLIGHRLLLHYSSLIKKSRSCKNMQLHFH